MGLKHKLHLSSVLLYKSIETLFFCFVCLFLETVLFCYLIDVVVFTPTGQSTLILYFTLRIMWVIYLPDYFTHIDIYERKNLPLHLVY